MVDIQSNRQREKEINSLQSSTKIIDDTGLDLGLGMASLCSCFISKPAVRP